MNYVDSFLLIRIVETMTERNYMVSKLAELQKRKRVSENNERAIQRDIDSLRIQLARDEHHEQRIDANTVLVTLSRQSYASEIQLMQTKSIVTGWANACAGADGDDQCLFDRMLDVAAEQEFGDWSMLMAYTPFFVPSRREVVISYTISSGRDQLFPFQLVFSKPKE